MTASHRLLLQQSGLLCLSNTIYNYIWEGSPWWPTPFPWTHSSHTVSQPDWAWHQHSTYCIATNTHLYYTKDRSSRLLYTLHTTLCFISKCCTIQQEAAAQTAATCDSNTACAACLALPLLQLLRYRCKQQQAVTATRAIVVVQLHCSCCRYHPYACSSQWQLHIEQCTTALHRPTTRQGPQRTLRQPLLIIMGGHQR